MGLFKPASRTKCKLRAAIAGPSGCGKTFTALRAAFALGKRVCMVATEPGAAEKYVGLSPDGTPWNFDILTLDDYSPSAYRQAIIAAGTEKYDVCIIDSLSHEWEGSGGALELVDKKAGTGRGNKFTDGWGQVTPMHRAMFEAIVRSPCHVLATVRTKTEYSLEKNDQGKTVPTKLGMKPVQREGVEYEFDVFARMDLTHTMNVEKTRCPNIDGLVAVKPDANTFAPLVAWLNDGIDPPEGYYTANEDDLRKSMEARAAAEKAAAKAAKASAPPETAAEKSARLEKQRTDAAAKQAEIDRLKTEAETKLAASKAEETRLLATATGDHATAQTVAKEIQTAKAENRMSPEEVATAEKVLREKADAQPAAANDDLCTRAQCIEVVDLCKFLFGDQVKTKLAALLAKASVAKVSELRRSDCLMLIQKLTAAKEKREEAAANAAKERQPGDEPTALPAGAALPATVPPLPTADDIPF